MKKTYDLRETLTTKEKEVYLLLCQLKTNEQIAEDLGLKIDTVKFRLRSIYRKLGVEAEDNTDKQSARYRAIAYSGTKIEQTISFSEENGERGYTLKHICLAAKKTPDMTREILENLISFLEIA